MSENFKELFEQSVQNWSMQAGDIIHATVLQIHNGFVLVDAGLKSEASIPLEQFKDDAGEITLKVGDTVEVALEAIEDNHGATRLSHEKAKRAKMWTKLEAAHENDEIVQGLISARVKGGFTVDINDVRAFLPGSLVDVRPLRDTSFLEGKMVDLKVIKVDAKRNNIVVSRRAVLETEGAEERDALLESLKEGMEVKGIVKNLTDYGAFVDLGGVDGLLHITDMSWKRVGHPSELLTVGDEIDIIILKFEKERGRVSLGMKQLGGDPWANLIQRFPEGKRMKGTVTNVADYGCFVEIEEGVEGLVHCSEMDWTNKNATPSKIVQVGQEVEVMVLDVDEDRRRISLGLKQCQANPWDKFAETVKKGDKVKGAIRSITDFGVFVGLEGGIDGLIHLSDLSWDKPGEEAVRDFNKGDDIETIILAIDVERERISLGVKQLANDPHADFNAKHERGAIMKGTVAEVTAEGATLDIGDAELKGYIRASDISRERVSDATKHFKVGDEVEARFMGIDRKNNMAGLSIRALEDEHEKVARKKLAEADDAQPTTTLGDLIKEKMGDSKK